MAPGANRVEKRLQRKAADRHVPVVRGNRAAGADDTQQLLQAADRVGQEEQHQSHDCGINVRIGQRQRLDVARDELGAGRNGSRPAWQVENLNGPVSLKQTSPMQREPSFILDT